MVGEEEDGDDDDGSFVDGGMDEVCSTRVDSFTAAVNCEEANWKRVTNMGLFKLVSLDEAEGAEEAVSALWLHSSTTSTDSARRSSTTTHTESASVRCEGIPTESDTSSPLDAALSMREMAAAWKRGAR